MPRSKWERPPGPLTTAPDVALVDFLFDADERHRLAELLAAASPRLNGPCAPPVLAQAASLKAAGMPVPETPAEWIIAAAEQQLRLLLSAQEVDLAAAPANPANYRAAIRRLRHALKPFTAGWADPKTAGLADWPAIDETLAARDKELEEIKRPAPYRKRELEYNCRLIATAAWWHAQQAGADLPEETILRFVHAALEAAGIDVPHPDDHRARLRRLVFGDAPTVSNARALER